MDGYKISTLVLAVVFLSAIASSIIYEVDVDESLNHSSFQLSYEEEITDVQQYSAVIDNTGSVGCTYRLANTLESGNYSRTDYSQPHQLWPGDSARISVTSVPINVTGQINSTLEVEYCGKNTVINKTSFEDIRNTSAQKEISSTTLKSEDGRITFKTGLNEAIAVPIGEPPYWKIGPVNISAGKAETSFEAPIFSEEKTVIFALVNKSSGDVMGRTHVKTGSEGFNLDNLPDELPWIGFLLSFVLNLVLGLLLIIRRRK